MESKIISIDRLSDRDKPLGEMLININNIIAVEPCEGGTKITLNNGWVLYASQSMSDLKHLIYG